MEQVLCEGGPQLLRAALAAGVVDELDLSISPRWSAAVPGCCTPRCRSPPGRTLDQVLTEDDVLFTRWSLRR